MRLIVLDYAGHLPQADLAKKLSEVGHSVLHLRCSDYLTGNADFRINNNSKGKLEFKGVTAGFKLNRYNILYRILHEYILSKTFFKAIKSYSPDFIIISNVPLFCSFLLTKRLKKHNLKYLFWWQDVYSLAIINELNSRLKFLKIRLNFRFIEIMEQYVINNSQSVVAISEKFRELIDKWDLESEKFHVLPNWSAPEDFIVPIKRTIELKMKFLLYAGTLGLKHDPKILIQIADFLNLRFPDVNIIVISQGLGREFLSKPENSRINLVLKDFVPFEVLREYLDQAIGVIAILEPNASEYSVPSKIMTYFCSGRAIIAAVPAENQVSQYIKESNSGFVVNPLNPFEINEAVRELILNNKIRAEMEHNSRMFAIKNFSGENAAVFFLSLME